MKKQSGLFQLFIAAGITVWATPYVLNSLGNTLGQLLLAGALPGTSYEFNPNTMFIIAACGALGVLAAVCSMVINNVRARAANEANQEEQSTIKQIRITSAQTLKASKRRQHLSQAKA
jgi:hypothetical protein